MQQQDPIGAAFYFQQACERDRYHHLDHQLALQALILSKQFSQAYNWAESGPKEHLTREYIEFWLVAARKVKAMDRVRELEQMLETNP